MRYVLAALLVAACNRAKSEPPAPAPVHAPTKPVPRAIPETTTQLLTAVPPSWEATTAELQLWQRQPGARWQPVGEAWTAVIGATGSAWGIGLHGETAPSGRPGPLKQEGDKKSPAGSFALRGSYGYATVPPPGTRLPYTPSDDHTLCIDDPASLHYTTIIDRATTAVDWNSAEQMHREDALYTWVIDIAHNPSHTPGDGSCIFLHVWQDASTPTVGCTAMPEAQLVRLLAQLDPAQHPLFVLLPQADYVALSGPWGLPPR
jgi:L,D-peptidoglycan transpeptidase YkuD (ErfK/YbiS/YcfS/YnhG family)